MRRLLLSLAVAIWVIILTFPAQAVSHAAGKTNSGMQIIEGPTLESATGSSAIIRWKTNTGSSPIEHSVVHYGTGPRDLSKKAESPNRWNPNLPYMTHRVQLMKLTPRTTYYYTVESVRGDGTPLGGKSNAVKHFTTESTPRRQTANQAGSH